MVKTSSSNKLSSASVLRIAFDAKRAFNNGTGLGNYSRFVIRALTQYFPQHEYFLFTPTVKPEFAGFIQESDTIKLITPDSFLGKTFSSFWRSYSIAGICNELKVDVYHGLSNELPVGMEHFKGKKLVTIHDLIFLRYPDYYNNIDRYIYTRKFRSACQMADMVIAASNQTAADLVSYFGTPPEKIKTIYQNCDPVFEEVVPAERVEEVLKSAGISKPDYLLCVGTVESRKDQLTVLKAFHQAALPQTVLVFIGRRTAYAEELDQYIQQHGLEATVIFREGVPHADLPALYQRAKAFIYASLFEGFGIPILEALRSRVPVLAANSSSLTEVGGKAALYFEPGDHYALADLMNKVMDADTRDQLIAAGNEQARLFGSERIAAEIAGLWI